MLRTVNQRSPAPANPVVPASRTRPADPVVPAPRRAEHGRCRRCGDPVIGYYDSADRLVPVHPVAVPGGELIINAAQAKIVQVLSYREASAARRRGELGFLPHTKLCRAPNPRRPLD